MKKILKWEKDGQKQKVQLAEELSLFWEKKNVSRETMPGNIGMLGENKRF